MQMDIKFELKLKQRPKPAEEVRITVTEDAVSFPWFSFTINSDETAAYTAFVKKLCIFEDALHPEFTDAGHLLPWYRFGYRCGK